MSLPRKPLGYACQDSVLRYLEPNKRLQLSVRSPSIRPLDRTIPLRLKSLELDGNFMKINDVLYQVHIERVTTENGETFNHTKNQDEDEFGFPVTSPSCQLQPGDAACNLPEFVAASKENDRMERSEEKRLQLVRRIGGLIEDLGNPNLDDVDKKGCSMAMENNLLKLLPFYYARHNLKPQCESFVKLWIVPENLAKIEEYRCRYNKPLWHFVKYLREIFFGNRQHPIIVDSFSILDGTGVIRLPVHMKFAIKDLEGKMRVRDIVRFIKPLLDKTSFPIRRLVCKHDDLVHDLNEGYFSNELVQNARKLYINSVFVDLHLIPHNNIVYSPYGADTIYWVLNNLKRHGRKIESRIEFRNSERTEEMFEGIKTEFRADEIGNNQIQVIMSDQNKLRISKVLFKQNRYRKEGAIIMESVNGVEENVPQLAPEASTSTNRKRKLE